MMPTSSIFLTASPKLPRTRNYSRVRSQQEKEIMIRCPSSPDKYLEYTTDEDARRSYDKKVSDLSQSLRCESRGIAR
ncbi:hypothetical protein DAPPUDRAFT_251466 [Daphnia pulex]|uniref:Uncharacterized protein n=1 Tax=Daphnia pulex TaxID=6669 RepID=E9H0H6_DAPPU|nr:hypothetical protein DAPPUDRAFT_251466 [Daphnia pulex]|eukprot:EFX74816.1 hypothetical protein DAPPUDRAFT_251466 [Daphnia pulex]